MNEKTKETFLSQLSLSNILYLQLFFIASIAKWNSAIQGKMPKEDESSVI